MKQLNSQSADLLREIVNIGASKSSTVLAECLGSPVRITVPMLREIALEEAATVLGPPERPVEALLLLFGGTFQGGVMLALSEGDGRLLREAVSQEDASGAEADAVLSNILDAFLASTSMFLFAELESQLSRRLYDMAGSLLPSLLGELDYGVDALWLAEVTMLPDGGEEIMGRLFFLGDATFYEVIEEMAG